MGQENIDYIRINDGDFDITIYPVEFNSYLPSFRAEVSCLISHPTGAFSYNASDIWFEKELVDHFFLSLKAMIDGNCESAKLECMSMYFVFEIKKVELVKLKCNISIKEFQPSNDDTILKASFILGNYDFLNTLYRNLLDLRLPW
jgi:hypothetical protein